MTTVLAHAAIETAGSVGFWGVGCLVGTCRHDHPVLSSRAFRWALVVLFNLVTAPITVAVVG